MKTSAPNDPAIETAFIPLDSAAVLRKALPNAECVDALFVLERLRARGIEPVQWGATAAGMRFAYVNTDGHPGGMIELIETGAPVEAFFAMIRKAATGWDGTRPLRRLT